MAALVSQLFYCYDLIDCKITIFLLLVHIRQRHGITFYYIKCERKSLVKTYLELSSAQLGHCE